MMADRHTKWQVRILSLTLRILLVSGRISQKELERAAKIAAAEVRAQGPRRPEQELLRDVGTTPKTESD